MSDDCCAICCICWACFGLCEKCPSLPSRWFSKAAKEDEEFAVSVEQEAHETGAQFGMQNANENGQQYMIYTPHSMQLGTAGVGTPHNGSLSGLNRQ